MTVGGKQVNLSKYQDLSKRTMPFSGEPKNQTESDYMLGNYAMGLAGEAIEAFRVHPLVTPDNDRKQEFIKELGDICHYAVGIASIFGRSFYRDIAISETKEFFLAEADDLMGTLVLETGAILENAKKRIYHRHILDWEKFEVFSIVETIAQLCKAYDIDFNDMLQVNIDKLRVRYPEKFTAADSIARVDEG